MRAGVFLALNVARHISLSVFTRAHAARDGAKGRRDPDPRPSTKARWAKLFRKDAGFYGAFNPSEDGGVVLERAAADDGVVIAAALRSDRSVAELSTRPLTGVDKRMDRRGGIELSSPNGGRIVSHAGEVSARVMICP
jgi:hypothetical protein